MILRGHTIEVAMYKLRFAAALLLVFLSASTSSALTPDEATSVVTGAYRVTTRTLLGDVKEPGSVLTPRREGLRANRPSKGFKANVVENHQLVVAGGGDLPLSGRDGALKPGERLYLYDVSTGDDYVQLDLYTVTSYHIPGVRWSTPLQASVRFRYKKGIAGITSQQLLDDIAEWVGAEGAAAPAATESRPAAKEASPATKEASPATKEANPATKEANPATKEANPATKEASPATKEASPATKEASPAASPDSAGKKTDTVRLGQSQQEVIAILGPPQKEIQLGSKAIFIYPNLKIIFIDGKVTDAE
jgi:hypothetical protein